MRLPKILVLTCSHARSTTPRDRRKGACSRRRRLGNVTAENSDSYASTSKSERHFHVFKPSAQTHTVALLCDSHCHQHRVFLTLKFAVAALSHMRTQNTWIRSRRRLGKAKHKTHHTRASTGLFFRRLGTLALVHEVIPLGNIIRNKRGLAASEHSTSTDCAAGGSCAGRQGRKGHQY